MIDPFGDDVRLSVFFCTVSRLKYRAVGSNGKAVSRAWEA